MISKQKAHWYYEYHPYVNSFISFSGNFTPVENVYSILKTDDSTKLNSLISAACIAIVR